MTIIQLRNRFYTLPTSWDELTGKQLIAVMKVINAAPEETAGKMMLLRILTGMPWYKWMFQKVEELEDELYNVDFLLSNYPVKQVLPSFKGLHGPAGDFDNLRIGEFAFCEFYFKEYEKKGAENGVKELNQLVGTLYRRQKRFYNTKINAAGDVRQPFNKNLTETVYPTAVKNWPIEVKLAVAAWFKGCRIQLEKEFKQVFSGGGDVAKYGLWSVMNSVAEKGNHGTFDKVEDMLIKEFFMELTESIEKAKKYEKANTTT